MEEAEGGGDLHAAAIWARRALRLAPHDEGQLRRLLTLLDRLGDRAGVLQAYDEFTRRLPAEFEAQPAAETQALVAAVRARVTAAAPKALRRGAPASPAPHRAERRRGWSRAGGTVAATGQKQRRDRCEAYEPSSCCFHHTPPCSLIAFPQTCGSVRCGRASFARTRRHRSPPDGVSFSAASSSSAARAVSR